MYASDHGFLECVVALIEAGADISQTNALGDTALSLADSEEIKDTINRYRHRLK